MGNKVIESINGIMPEEPESYCSSDLAIFKPRFFVEDENQFDCYHFVMPRVVEQHPPNLSNPSINSMHSKCVLLNNMAMV